MTMDSTEDKVFKVFSSVLQLSVEDTRENLEYNVTKGWNSIGHMTIISGLEEAFDCMLDTDDVLDMSSFQKAIGIMEKYIS